MRLALLPDPELQEAMLARYGVGPHAGSARHGAPGRHHPRRRAPGHPAAHRRLRLRQGARDAHREEGRPGSTVADLARDLDACIDQLQRLRDDLDGCIGCGCLSLDRCALFNPDDPLGLHGPGARTLDTTANVYLQASQQSETPGD